jgi:hypothetical protein
MIGILKGRFTRTAAAATTPGGDEAPRWVVIAIVSWAEAEVMRSKLESEGIPCLLQREAAGAAIGITIGPLGEVRVLVPESLAERAIDLLSEEVDDAEQGSEDDFGELPPDSPSV